MNTRTVRAEYPIEDSNLPAPHLRLLARAQLADHLETLGVVAVSDAQVRVISSRRTVVAQVEVTPRVECAWHPSAESASVCPACHALLSGVAA